MMLDIAWQTLRHRLGSFVGSLIALTGGVAMLTSTILVILSTRAGGLDAGDAELIQEITSLLGLFASLAAFLSIFVVAATFAFAVGRRERELALLRGIGATGRQIRRLVVLEGLLVSLVASVAGTLLGLPGATLLVSVLTAQGFAPESFGVVLSADTLGGAMAGSIGLCVTVAVLGTVGAARRAATIRPIEALREASVEPTGMRPMRWAAGLFFLAMGIGVAAYGMTEGGVTGIVLLMGFSYPLLIGLALLAPVFVGPVTTLVTALPARLTTATGSLAAGNVRTSGRRSAGTAAPVLLAVGLTVSTLGTLNVLVVAGETESRAFYAGDVLIDVEPHVDATAAAADAAGVSGVSLAAVTVSTRASLSRIDGAWTMDGRDVLGVDPAVVDQAFAVEIADGTLDDLHGGTVALHAASADELGWSVGDEVSVGFPDGADVPVRVAALFEGGAMGDHLPVLAPADLVREHSAGTETSSVWVRTESPRLVASVHDDLTERMVDSAARVLTTDEYFDELTATDRLAQRVVTLVLAGFVLTYTLISVANTALMSFGSRTREFALLGRLGATRGQILRMIAWESLSVGAVGVLLGGLAAAGASIATWMTVRMSMPSAPLVLPWGDLAAVGGCCLIIALGASLLPAVFAVRQGRAPND
ncbi:putative ABC transport system permease protein [Actinoalloteichus hoggarensis]|uniref:Outer membrane-specific lipoprotein transporter subunit LolE n=1 Tax=Actinoalloteichus hoggarensis TaxID=1470176 RepID=A0A221VY49_9PSEU|nr:ABC transporter permease [Actinoalloteichus hoggarensis]ASO18482.1 outer membrane-specific lipoprotein transporter subunit LolE [Actinoalloteichus hoggarensis]MBB5921850.1 putative ABC transport system permease protein [Actinoalloteichus hoggarensis]